MNQSMPAASILGIGAVTPLGRDLAKISETIQLFLQTPVQRFAEEPDLISNNPDLSSTPEPAFKLVPRRVDDSILTLDPALNTQMRRADRFTKMAGAAAIDAWNAAGASCVGIPAERIGLFVCSGFGPHCRGFKFLDGILDSGDTAASPTDFSHSVHGVASAYISRRLDLRGPSLATTDFEIGFEEAIQVAQCWLNEGACDRVLIGAVEELGEVYLSCASRIIKSDESICPGEGAVFLVLARDDVAGMARLNSTALPARVDLVIAEDPVILPSTAPVLPVHGRRATQFTSLFGHSASATAFYLLGGLLMMQKDKSIDTAATLRTSSEGRSVMLLLER